MVISIKNDNLTVAVELEENGFDKTVSCEEILFAAYDIISRVFSQTGVIRARAACRRRLRGGSAPSGRCPRAQGR